MSDAFYVWCQLYFRGEGGQYNGYRDQPVDIDISRLDRDIANNLKRKVKKEAGLKCGLNEILIYRPGTNLNTATDDDAIKSNQSIAVLVEELKNTTPPTEFEHPLMVVVPAPPQQRQNIRPREEDNGKKCSRFVSLSSFSDIVVLV